MPSVIPTTTSTATVSFPEKVEASTTKSVVSGPPQLHARFAALKREIIRPENEEAVKASYERLKVALAVEVERIGAQQTAAIPECKWSDVVANGGKIPEDVARQAKVAGCILFRGLFPAEQCLKWKAELFDYTKRHAKVGGKPKSDPTTWLLYWTRPQVQLRSHPEMLKAMHATSALWNITDDTLPIDPASQIAYCDRIRLRKPWDKAYSLKAHLDSSSTERWEDPAYRSCYRKIFEGKWEEYDPWCMDQRADAKVDLYQGTGSCSGFRSFQGWLSLSDCGPGEGTLRVLPNIKLATAYIMLRPFFQNESLDISQPTLPGATPGRGQLFVTSKYHPHLEQDRTIISVQKVHPGDYMFWHTDLAHEVEDENNGPSDSSVIYVPNVPLCPYNIQNMLNHRKAFREVVSPPDYVRDFGGPYEYEREHEDHGARVENILTVEGKRALGLVQFDENEPGITEGQKKPTSARLFEAERVKLLDIRLLASVTTWISIEGGSTSQKSRDPVMLVGSGKYVVRATLGMKTVPCVGQRTKCVVLRASQVHAATQDTSSPNSQDPSESTKEDVIQPYGPAKEWISIFVGSSGDQDPFVLRHCSFNDLNYYKQSDWACLRVNRNGGESMHFTLVPDSHLDARPHYYPKVELQQIVPEDITQLRRTFFETIHTSFPLLHPAQIEQENKPGDLLLATIYEIASPYISERSNPNDWKLLDWIFQAMPIEIRQPKLETIEAGLLFLQRHARYHRAPFTPGLWSEVGSLVGICHDVGLNVNPMDWDITIEDQHRRIRLWWGIYMQDKWCALGLGRPSYIANENFNVPLPTIDNFPTENYQDLPSPTIGILQFVGMAALTTILSDILATFYTVRANERFKSYNTELLRLLLEQFQQRLADFYDKHLIPLDHCQGFLDPTGTIFLAYHTVQLTLYRVGLRTLDPQDFHYHLLRNDARVALKQVVGMLDQMTVRRLRAFWWSQMSNINFAMAGGFMMSLLLTSTDDTEIEYWTDQIKLYQGLLQNMDAEFNPTKLAAARMTLLSSASQNVGGGFAASLPPGTDAKRTSFWDIPLEFCDH
ncbi:hypothetical protein B7463_g11271, partial [Scytalidium lignicola]